MHRGRAVLPIKNKAAARTALGEKMGIPTFGGIPIFRYFAAQQYRQYRRLSHHYLSQSLAVQQHYIHSFDFDLLPNAFDHIGFGCKVFIHGGAVGKFHHQSR